MSGAAEFATSALSNLDPVDILATSLVIMGVYAVLFIAAAGSPLARALLFKTNLLARSLAHMLLSREKSGWPKRRPDPKVIAGSPAFLATKRIIFVRHGESTWNEVFNRGFNLGFPFRLFEGLLSELLLLPTKSSFFVDAPLSDLGYEQAANLREYLRSFHPAHPEAQGSERRVADAGALAGVKGTSVIVASNLRRAAATTALAFWDRLARTGEKIYVLSCLQEMARNVDTCALAGPRQAVPLHGIESKVRDVNATPMGRMRVGDSGSVVGLNPHWNVGNKPIARSGWSAMREFAEWSVMQDADVIIVGGHSLWFKEFFKAHLDFDAAKTHVAAKKKIVNCGVVGFTLQHDKHPEHGEVYRIDPESVDAIYGGFDARGKK
jgi:hypothetical protein